MNNEGSDIGELFYGTVTVGERGQIVVPAQAREDYQIKPGDKLLVFAHPGGCGLMLVNVANIGRIVPIMEETLRRMKEELAQQDAAVE